MKNQVLFGIAYLLSATSALHLQFSHDFSPLTSSSITLQSSSGNYLGRCNDCGQEPDSITVHRSDPTDPEAIWNVQPYSGGQIKLRTDNMKLVSPSCTTTSILCKTYPDTIRATIQEEPTQYSLWTPQQLENGKWAFKGSNGKYLARCSECPIGDSGIEAAYVHKDSSEDPDAQWTVSQV